MKSSHLRNVLLLIVIGMLFFTTNPGLSQDTIATTIDSIETEIELIRGKKFKHEIQFQNQSLEDFGKYLDDMIDKQFPETLQKNYGKIVRKLGLYRGPEIKDFRKLIKMVMQTQAAAYYDPASSTFYVVMQDLPGQAMKAIFAHELYHGFQDQYHDLSDYILDSPATLNDDELIARQAVVEGEATYIMTLWSMKNMFGNVPDRATLKAPITMQANLNVEQLLQMVKSGTAAQALSGDMKKATEALDKIPRFLIETLIGAYLKGMRFVFEIQEQGWSKVDSLYVTPPASSEQILHPEKWLADEVPYRLTWPDFSNASVFKNWSLLESNTIGELQWRIIFSEHKLATLAQPAAGGWDGDRFAVLQHNNSKELLLLLYTCWDYEEEAEEFLNAYERLLETKYPEGKVVWTMEMDGNEVFIVEGGLERDHKKYFSFMRQSKKIKN